MEHKLILNYPEYGDYFYEEAIKTLRTNVQFCGSSVKTIMLTSSLPDEGKSETAFSLAVSLGSIGKRVLLIDADIRKSVMVSRCGITEYVYGLSQYLSGQRSMEDIIYSTNLEGLDVILAGPYSPNPAELLEESLFKSLLAYGKENYDYVIIDTPPMANLIDGAIIAGLSDGAVLVVRSGEISYRLAQKVKKQLERSGCRMLGVVLNRVGTKKDGSYYKKYYGKYGKYSKYKYYENESSGKALS